MSALARVEIGCTSSALGIICSDAAEVDQSKLVSSHRYACSPGGSVAVVLPPACVIAATDRFYGGRATLTVADTLTELSPTEDWMAARIADSILAEFSALLPDLVPIDQVQRDHQRAAAFAGDWPDAFVQSELTISGLAADPFNIELLFALSAAQQMEELLSAKSREPIEQSSGSTVRALASPIGDVRLRARIVLARPELPLSRLMTLSEGDLLRVVIPPSLPLLVDDRILASGTLGAVGGAAAFRIDEPRQEQMSS